MNDPPVEIQVADSKLQALHDTQGARGVQHSEAFRSAGQAPPPEGFDLESAALLGDASVSCHNAMRASVGSTENVLGFGSGLIGLFAAQACRVLGARVTVTDLSEGRLALAEQLGADRVIQAGQPHELAVLHAGHSDNSDLENAVHHVEAKDIKIRPLISTVVPIDDALQVYDTLRDNPTDLLGTVFGSSRAPTSRMHATAYSRT